MHGGYKLGQRVTHNRKQYVACLDFTMAEPGAPSLHGPLTAAEQFVKDPYAALKACMLAQVLLIIHQTVEVAMSRVWCLHVGILTLNYMVVLGLVHAHTLLADMDSENSE